MQHGGIEVWTARPEGLGEAARAQLAGLLDAQERGRAAQLRFDADRAAFITAHALRRMALGLALAMDPQDLRFGSDAHGRPVLLDLQRELPSFSLTRSRGLVACALSHAGSVGIDVEAVHPGMETSLLEPFLVPGVLDALAGQEDDFHLQWTGLEAFWKARGLGLSASHPRISLRALDVDGFYEVVYGDTLRSTGMVVVRLPASPGHVLSLACDTAADVRLVQLDCLAGMPAADPYKGLSKSKNGDCQNAAASSMADS